MKTNILPLFCLLLCIPACSKKNMSTNSKPQVQLLIKNNGFEEEGGWTISAPPNYTFYGEMNTKDEFRQSGKHCGLIRLQRLPGYKGELILHAFTQPIEAIPNGKTILFGGWVSASTGTKIRISIEYETAEPHNGQTLFSKNLIWSGDGDKFHFLSDRITFPADVSHAYFIAAIASPGEVRFDNLFAFVDPRQPAEQKKFTGK